MRALRKLRSADDGARRVSAEEIRTARFGQSPMAWRGFSEEEVGAFLRRVAGTVEADEAERAALRTEVERLRHFYRSHGEAVDEQPLLPGRRPPPSPGDVPSRLAPRLDAITANAERYADLVAAPAPAANEARELLVHAEVSVRIGVEELVADFLRAYAHQPAAAAGELRRTQVWLDELTHALTRQLAAVYAAVEEQLADPGVTAR